MTILQLGHKVGSVHDMKDKKQFMKDNCKLRKTLYTLD